MASPAAARASRAATPPRRREAWLTIFVVRRRLPCDRPAGVIQALGMIPPFPRLRGGKPQHEQTFRFAWSGPAIDGSNAWDSPLLDGNPARAWNRSSRSSLLESPGPSPGGGRHGQANRRTAAAHLLGRVCRGHHICRNPAPLKSRTSRWGRCARCPPLPARRTGVWDAERLRRRWTAGLSRKRLMKGWRCASLVRPFYDA
jgi:hypothetical protein